MIIYKNNLKGISPVMLEGFFAEWGAVHPSKSQHLEILKNSSYVILAIDDETNKVVGFINAISDKIISAYIPLLEVLTSYRNKGIGSELVRRMIHELRNLYMIDLICDENIIPFYERAGFKKHNGMLIRNYNNKAGAIKSKE